MAHSVTVNGDPVYTVSATFGTAKSGRPSVVSSSGAAPGFCNRGGIEVWVYRGSRVRSPPEADTFTAVHREFVGFGTV